MPVQLVVCAAWPVYGPWAKGVGDVGLRVYFLRKAGLEATGLRADFRHLLVRVSRRIDPA